MLYSAIDTSQIIIVVILVAVVGLMLVMPMLNNKKRSKAIVDLHSSLKAGDKIMTIGGIIGTIIEIRQTSPVDKELVIETGVPGATTTMVMDIKALYQVIPPVTANYVPEPVANEVFESETAETIEVTEDESDKA